VPQHETFGVVILGSGQGGKHLAWHLGRSGTSVAVVERQWVGVSCAAVACLPSKNEIWTRVAHLVRHAGSFGTAVDGVRTDMARVRRRKQDMIDREIELHLDLNERSP
jgi:pyruvate/2-oxoglutarate dehydrogenase complex dihydrolipoamide dehydrogenase (E3) component